MKDLILNLQKKFDMVLLDSPPLVAVTDASILAQATRQTKAIVVMPGKQIKNVAHSIQTLENMSANVDVLIFNEVDSKNSYSFFITIINIIIIMVIVNKVILENRKK